MDGALVHGRANDCDGYEIHYSQKCKWKAYDDFKTGNRVLTRLDKCYTLWNKSGVNVMYLPFKIALV